MTNSAMGGGQWANAVFNQKQKAAEMFADMENPMDTAAGATEAPVRKTNSLIGISESLPPLQSPEEIAWEKEDIKTMKRNNRVEQVSARARAGAKKDADRDEKERKRKELRANGGVATGNKEGNTVLESLRGDEFRARRASGTAGKTPGIIGDRSFETPGSMMGPDATTGTTDIMGSAKQDALTSTDVDSADNRRAYRVSSSSSGNATTTPSSFEARIAMRPGYAEGKTYLEAAGRCNHPRCQMLREKGLELTGAITRFTGIGVESPLEAIPSVPVDERVYPIVNGKQDRKNAQTVRTYKPADITHPEWVARGGNPNTVTTPGAQVKTNPEAAAMRAANPDIFKDAPVKPGKGASSQDMLDYRKSMWDSEFSHPSNLLEHHHFEGDDDFVTHPLPWESK